jgi:PadR family transcriptional regulator PadR
MTEPMHLLRGTLDALVLKAVSAGPLHGYGIADFVHEKTRGVLEIEDGALYRALHRMEERGWLAAEWGVSAQGRRAKFYRLTSDGRSRLESEQRDWERYAEAVSRVFASRRGAS